MSTEHDAAVAAEAALAKAKATAHAPVVEAAPAEPVKPSKEGQLDMGPRYLGPTGISK